MHDLLPLLPGNIDDVLTSIPYFMPEFYLSILFLIVLVTDLIFGRDSEKLCRIIVCAGLLLVAHKDYQQIELLLYSGQANGRFLFSGMLLLTHTVISFKLVIDVLAFALLLYFGWDDKLKGHGKGLSDLYTIAAGAVFSLHLMTMAANLLSIYLSIEMVSIASYLMVAYRTESSIGTEAGMKYVLFGAAASAITLYGISLLYGFGGTLALYSGNLLLSLSHAGALPVSVALFLVLAGIGFKLSFVPVHFWVPDVYQGTSTPVTAWLSTLPKIAGFALLINFLRPFIYYPDWKAFDFQFYLAIIGIVTMMAGNFAALLQKNIKRMLAYSSIGHTGFALMAIVVFKPESFSALIFYLAAYGIANIGAMALATYFSNAADAENTDSYRGLGFKFPVASVCWVIVLVSLTGLPITAGFSGKLLIFSTTYGFFQQVRNPLLLALLVTGAITTIISLFYYIKIPRNLFLKRAETSVDMNYRSLNIIIFSIIACFLVILLGIKPDFLLNFI
ncbi:MAG TPA: NADH-quinone oxidoreductase subunit N [Mucilaginibacter sp.]|jgi:NADH-quinone oxidoreductase subunit N|nr:NADH-quinone oxidoreductase subunit N [Mucilaginibacter sp.]